MKHIVIYLIYSWDRSYRQQYLKIVRCEVLRLDFTYNNNMKFFNLDFHNKTTQLGMREQPPREQAKDRDLCRSEPNPGT